MAKIFTYRGKELVELQQMNTREFARLTKSRTRRAILRQSEKIDKFVSKCVELSGRKKQIRTHLREIVIVPKMVGYKVFIYNGKQFLDIEIVSEMLGHRLGEFSITRQKIKHGAAGLGATKSSMAKATKK
jgi:small subunit ribosomal protein S19